MTSRLTRWPYTSSCSTTSRRREASSARSPTHKSQACAPVVRKFGAHFPQKIAATTAAGYQDRQPFLRALVAKQYRARKQAAVSFVSRLLTRAVLLLISTRLAV